jgi:hypothetical protein
MKYFLALSAFAIIGLSACKKDGSNGKNPPSISFVGMTPNTVLSGNPKDTVFISFKVADKDGDLGIDDNTGYDIYIKDSRDNSAPQGLAFPSLPKEITEDKQGIKALCTIRIYASLFLIKRNDPIHAKEDTLTYEIYVKDKASHESNRITTPPIYIQ